MITLTFIVGFGITQILNGVTQVIRAYPKVNLNWIPIAWASVIFMQHIQYWFGIISIHRAMGEAPDFYWTFLLLAILLFLAGSLILPTSFSEQGEALTQDFDLRGKRALLPLAAFALVAAISNYTVGGNLLGLDVLLNLVMMVSGVVGFVFSQPWVRRLAVIVYLAAFSYGFLFVWARPGNI